MGLYRQKGHASFAESKECVEAKDARSDEIEEAEEEKRSPEQGQAKPQAKPFGGIRGVA